MDLLDLFAAGLESLLDRDLFLCLLLTQSSGLLLLLRDLFLLLLLSLESDLDRLLSLDLDFLLDFFLECLFSAEESTFFS